MTCDSFFQFLRFAEFLELRRVEECQKDLLMERIPFPLVPGVFTCLESWFGVGEKGSIAGLIPEMLSHFVETCLTLLDIKDHN
jgi:hypothetical protein